jgi:opacity protein-like surface antigen
MSATAGMGAGPYWAGVKVGGVIPVDDLADVAGGGYTLGIGVGYNIGSHLMLTLGISYDNFGEKTISQTEKLQGSVVPILLGAHYYFGSPERRTRLYIAGKVGSYVWRGDYKRNEYGGAGGIGLNYEVYPDSGGSIFFEADYNYSHYDDGSFSYVGVFVGMAWSIGG